MVRVERDIEGGLAVERLRARFPGKGNSWVRRALRRFESGSVRQLGEDAWVVIGDPKLGGDKYLATSLGLGTVGTLHVLRDQLGGLA